MKALLILILLAATCSMAQSPPPIQRNYFTTNQVPVASGSSNVFNPIFTNPTVVGNIGTHGIGADTATNYQVSIGFMAGTNGRYSTIVGGFAAHDTTSAESTNYATFVGYSAGRYSTNCQKATIVGGYAGLYATNARNATLLGYASGIHAVDSTWATIVGFDAGYWSVDARYLTAVGAFAGMNSDQSPYGTFIGANSGAAAVAASNSIAIGYAAEVTGDNQIQLGQTNQPWNMKVGSTTIVSNGLFYAVFPINTNRSGYSGLSIQWDANPAFGYSWFWYSGHARMSNSMWGSWIDFNDGLSIGSTNFAVNERVHLTADGDVIWNGIAYGDGSGITNVPVVQNTTNTFASVIVTNSALSNNGKVTITNGNVTATGNLTLGTNFIVDTTSATPNFVAAFGKTNMLCVTNSRVGIGRLPESYTLEINGNLHASSSSLFDGDVVSSIFRAPSYGAVTLGGTTTASATIGSTNTFVSGAMNVTNGLYYLVQTNTGIATNVMNPTFCWGSMTIFGITNLVQGGANNYAVITNWTSCRTNYVYVDLVRGVMTNKYAGFYRCSIHLSGVSVDAGATVEGDMLINGVVKDDISFITVYDPGTPRYKGMSAFGILYLPANSQVTFQVKSSGAGGVNISRAQMMIGTP